MRVMMGHAWPWLQRGKYHRAVQKQPARRFASSGSRRWMRRGARLRQTARGSCCRWPQVRGPCSSGGCCR
eukprot:166449-Pelagomonas_calceolata.AAC.1